MHSREIQQILRGTQVGTVSVAAIVAMNILFTEGWDSVLLVNNIFFISSIFLIIESLFCFLYYSLSIASLRCSESFLS